MQRRVLLKKSGGQEVIYDPVDVRISVSDPGGYFRNFWVGMYRSDPGTLNLYQSYDLGQNKWKT